VKFAGNGCGSKQGFFFTSFAPADKASSFEIKVDLGILGDVFAKTTIAMVATFPLALMLLG